MLTVPEVDPDNANLPVEKSNTQISVVVEGPAKLPCPAIPGEHVSNVFYAFFGNFFVVSLHIKILYRLNEQRFIPFSRCFLFVCMAHCAA